MKIIVEIDVPGVGQKIRDARKLSGRTVKELAEDVGVSPQTWYQIENEAYSIHADVIRQIEKVLQAELARLRVDGLIEKLFIKDGE